MDNINSKGFYIMYSGDPSVGIFDQIWEIKGDFFFDTQDELDEFKNQLIETWLTISDGPLTIESFEDRDFWIQKERELFDEQDIFDLTV